MIGSAHTDPKPSTSWPRILDIQGTCDKAKVLAAQKEIPQSSLAWAWSRSQIFSSSSRLAEA
jgi:hypothetical protein